MEGLKPKDHAEAMALFRSEIVGALTKQELARGALKDALKRLSEERFRPPGADRTKAYSFTTLERWYYAYRKAGLPALSPTPRSDKGRAQGVPLELKALLLDIRREHPSASAPLILRTLELDGRLKKGTLSPQTLRRLYEQEGLDRVAARDGDGPKTRLRWQAEKPGALWHGDVCHGPSLRMGEVVKPLRIHALMDDASRFVVALEAHHTEKESDMLGLLVRALKRHGRPDAIFLDNGSTYRGEVLRTACGRLGISLLHARPYDAQARGKMERFWRTLREGCLDFLGRLSSLHDVNVRLWAFIDEHYHRAPHAGLLGKTPGSTYSTGELPPDGMDEKALFDALTVRVRRRVRRDTTVPVRGKDWQLTLGFLAGRVVTIGYSLAQPDAPPWLEHQKKRLPLLPVNPTQNARTKRPPRRPKPVPSGADVTFDPPTALLDRAAGRLGKKESQP